MEQLLSSEVYKSLATAGIGGIILTVCVKLIERVVPSRTEDATTQAGLRRELWDEICRLRDQVAEATKMREECREQYFELQGNYNSLTERCNELRLEVNALKHKYERRTI